MSVVYAVTVFRRSKEVQEILLRTEYRGNGLRLVDLESRQIIDEDEEILYDHNEAMSLIETKWNSTNTNLIHGSPIGYVTVITRKVIFDNIR